MLRVPGGMLDLPKPGLAIGRIMDDKVQAGIVAAAGVAFAIGPSADFNRRRMLSTL